jgi:F420-0:gamma-glutamyl ligase-like protein
LRLKVFKIKTKYWRPYADFLSIISKSLEKLLEDGDIICVSEKALSVALGTIVDESSIIPGSLAKFLSAFWVRKFWAGPLGNLVKFKRRTITNLTNYPIIEGAKHKEVCLRYSGFLQALRHYSEGGIDASNLPYSFVSLPLKKPGETALKIRNYVKDHTKKNSIVMIVDGDSTFSYRNLHLAPRKVELKGLIHFGGFFTYIFGRIFGFRERSTPIAVSGAKLNPDRALWFAELAHATSGPGVGRTVWSMTEKMGTSLTGLTWEMLESGEHAPIVLIRVLDN